MAAKLGKGAAKPARQMPTRKARGAGGAKPKSETARLKDAIPKTSTKTAPAPGSVNHDAQVREALQLQLIGLRQKHRSVDTEMDALRDEMKELNARRKEIRNAIKTAGMPLKLFDEAYLDAGTSRVDLERKENLRGLIREAYGLASGAQGSLLDKLPDAAKPEVYWEAEGYKDGIAGKDPKVPQDCPPENGQHYMRGYTNAQKRNAEGIKKLEKTEEAAAEAPADEDGPTSGEVVDMVEQHAEGANGSAVPDTGIASLDEWAKGEGEPKGDEELGADGKPMMAETMGVIGNGQTPKAGDDFEASPAELDKQNGRRAIREKRESQLLN